MRELNVRYRQVTSSLGLITTRRIEVPVAVTLNSNVVTFVGIEKADAVFYKIGAGIGARNKTLDEITNDEMLTEPLRTGKPSKFSVFTVTPNSVIIHMNCAPTVAFTLYAHALADASALSGTASPTFPASYHDILIYGVEADEYKRKEKVPLAAQAEQAFQSRLSDLRMFIAKSAYQDLHRGKHAKAEDWWDYNRNQ